MPEPKKRIFIGLIVFTVFLITAITVGLYLIPYIGLKNIHPLAPTVVCAIQTLDEMLDALYRLRITHLVAVPTMLALALRYGRRRLDGLHDLRLIACCGAPLPTELWGTAEARLGCPVVNVYGLTETVVGGLFAGPEPETRRHGTVGRPVDCEARVTGANGEVLGDAQPGGLEIRGSLVMAGYLHAPEATTRALTSDGWFSTGDVAVRDADGLYRVLGRTKEALIIRGGYNVHPDEVTEVLLGRSEVREAVTFGVPDPVWGERVLSAVVLDPQRPVTEAALIAHCRSQLEEQKVPSNVVVLPELPRGRSHKVSLDDVRQLVEDVLARARTVATDDGENVEAGVLAEAAACFRVSPESLDLDTTPDRCPGWDSLAHLSLVEALERRFGVELWPEEILAIDSLRRAAEMIAARR